MLVHMSFAADRGFVHPIVLAGMAFVGTTPDLAVAVSRAGALGGIAAGPLPGEAVRGLVRAYRSATPAPLHVNFITFLAREDAIRVCVEERVPFVSFHWGHPPRAFIEQLHAGGCEVWEQVGSVRDALQAAEAGVDVIVAQGSEAGGHNLGTLPLLTLLPQVVDAVSPLPVLAAGGIVDGRGIAAALTLGAAAAWMGTRFVATEEANAHDAYKRRLLGASGDTAVLSSLFGPDMPHFNPMRVLRNGVVAAFEGREDERPHDTASGPVIGRTELLGRVEEIRRFSSWVPMRTTEGDLDEMPLLAGQGVGLIRTMERAGALIERMSREAADVLRNLAGQARRRGHGALDEPVGPIDVQS